MAAGKCVSDTSACVALRISSNWLFISFSPDVNAAVSGVLMSSSTHSQSSLCAAASTVRTQSVSRGGGCSETFLFVRVFVLVLVLVFVFVFVWYVHYEK